MSARAGWMIKTAIGLLVSRRSGRRRAHRVMVALAIASSTMALQWPAGAASASDISGTWKITTETSSLEPEAGSIPFTAEGRANYETNRRLRALGQFDDYDITTSRCSLPGVPRLMLNPMRFKIWEQLSVVTMGFEWNRAIRQIDMSGVPKELPLVPDMNGISEGRWEGDTLVAVTRDFTGRTLVDDLLPLSPSGVITERLRLIDSNTLENHITVEDPENYTGSWSAIVIYTRQPNVFFPEDVCLDRIQAGGTAIPNN
jgi:hypothetical protein